MGSLRHVAARAAATFMLGLAVMALGLAVTACGGQASPDASSSVELFAYVSNPTSPPPPASYWWTKAVKQATGVDVKLTFVTDPSQYTQVLTTRAAANNLPDLYYTDPATQSQLTSQGLAADWRPLLGKMPNWVKSHDTTRFDAAGTFDGKLTALTSRTGYPYKNVVVIRKDWLQKLHLSVPKTLDQYLTVMKAFTYNDPDGNGKNDTYGWDGAVNSDGSLFGFDPIFGAFDALGTWEQNGNAVDYVGTTDKFRQALAFIDKMNQAGVIEPDWKAQTPEDTTNQNRAGKVGMMEMDWCGALCIVDYPRFHSANPKGVWEIIDPPVGPTGASAAGTYSAAALGLTAGGPQLGISQRAIDEGKGDAIAKLLNWMGGPGYITSVFGQEGKDKGYIKNSHGQIQSTGLASYAPYLQLLAMALQGTPQEIQSRYGLSTVTQGDGSKWNAGDWIKQLPAYPKKDVTSLAAMPPPPAEVAADLVRTINEGVSSFASGQQPLSGWANYVATVKREGLDQWTADATRRLREVGTIK